MSRIRSAGRTSGSIEITLPPALQTFTGIGCRVVVRDGLRPEIVLQPDLATARARLAALWQQLSSALGAAEPADAFSPNVFALTLLRTRQWNADLPLAYADMISLARSGEAWSEDDLAALARMLSVLAASIGRTLGLQSALASAFGDAVAYAVTQVPAGSGSDFERSMAAGLFRQAELGRRLTSPFDEEFWRDCEPALRRICLQFLAWQNDPDQYGAARRRWHRALQCESVPGCAEPCAVGDER